MLYCTDVRKKGITKFGDKWVDLEGEIENILWEDGNRWNYMRE